MTDPTEPTQEIQAIPAEARKWGMITHVVALVGLLGNGIGFLLGPVIVWMLKREEHPFVDEQGKEAVNFQITMMIAGLISVVLMFVGIGFILIAVVGLVATIFPIIAGIKANEGESYRYPLTYRFIK